MSDTAAGDPRLDDPEGFARAVAGIKRIHEGNERAFVELDRKMRERGLADS